MNAYVYYCEYCGTGPCTARRNCCEKGRKDDEHSPRAGRRMKPWMFQCYCGSRITFYADNDNVQKFMEDHGFLRDRRPKARGFWVCSRACEVNDEARRIANRMKLDRAIVAEEEAESGSAEAQRAESENVMERGRQAAQRIATRERKGRALTYDCPTCFVGIGVLCQPRSPIDYQMGWKADSVHLERMKLAGEGGNPR